MGAAELDPPVEILDAIETDLRAIGRRIDRLGSAIMILASGTPDLSPEQCRRILELLER